MPNPQRDKGHRFEREVARQLRQIFSGTARNIQSRDGSSVADVDNGVFVVECKHQLKPNIRAALQQAEQASRPGVWTIAVCKFERDRRGPIVAMRLDEFLQLVGEWKQRGER